MRPLLLVLVLVGGCVRASSFIPGTKGDGATGRSDRSAGEARGDLLTTGDGRIGPTVSWLKVFSTTCRDEGRGVAVDNAGHVYVTGFVGEEHDPATQASDPACEPQKQVTLGDKVSQTHLWGDIFIAAYDSAGVELWSAVYGGIREDVAEAITADMADNVQITGAFAAEVDFGQGEVVTSPGSAGGFMAAFTRPSGEATWSSSFTGTQPNSSGLSLGGTSDRLCVAASLKGTVNQIAGCELPPGTGAIALACISYPAICHWSTRISASNGSEWVPQIAVDGSGDLTLIGHFSGTLSVGGKVLSSATARAPFAARFDGSGALKWAQAFAATADALGNAVALDGAGNTYVTGEFSGNLTVGATQLTSKGATDIFVASLDSSGQPRWARSFGSTVTDRGVGLAVDQAGNSYIAGAFSGSISFGTTQLTSKGATDIFVASLDPSGQPRWARSFGGTGGDEGSRLALSEGGLYVTGYFEQSLTFDIRTVSSQGKRDAFLLALPLP